MQSPLYICLDYIFFLYTCSGIIKIIVMPVCQSQLVKPPLRSFYIIISYNYIYTRYNIVIIIRAMFVRSIVAFPGRVFAFKLNLETRRTARAGSALLIHHSNTLHLLLLVYTALKSICIDMALIPYSG